MDWKKSMTKLTPNGDGAIARTVRYISPGTGWAIESRKRPIEHANGGGYNGAKYWMFTSYFLIRPDGSEKEYHSLKDAKAAAEKEANDEDNT